MATRDGRAPCVSDSGRQSPATDHRCRQGARDSWRSERWVAHGVRRAPRADHGLMAETAQTFGLSLQPTRVHHVAIVVRDMAAALETYRDRLRLPLDVLLPIES